MFGIVSHTHTQVQTCGYRGHSSFLGNESLDYVQVPTPTSAVPILYTRNTYDLVRCMDHTPKVYQPLALLGPDSHCLVESEVHKASARQAVIRCFIRPLAFADRTPIHRHCHRNPHRRRHHHPLAHFPARLVASTRKYLRLG
jgi:hypothetical protein